MYHRPLLNLNYPDLTSPLQQKWSAREEEIEARIRQTMTVAKKEKIHFLHGRRIENNQARQETKNGEKIVIRDTHNVHRRRKNVENWWKGENQDLLEALGQSLRPGDSVCSFLSGHDAVLPTLILQSLGPNGELTILTPGPYLKSGLYAHFTSLLMNLKGFSEKMTQSEKKAQGKEEFITGASLVTQRFRKDANTYLSYPYRYGDNFYRDGLDEDKQGLAERFYDRFHIYPVRYYPPTFPENLRNCFDAIVECDRFSEIEEHDQEDVLRQLDQALKVGGYLIFREGSRNQVAIEYYGEEILSKYQRIRLSRVKSEQLVVFRKTGILQTPEVKPQTAFEEERSPDEHRQSFYLAVEQAIGEGAINGDLKDKLSISWFRKVGLLEAFLTSFKGDLASCADFVIAEHTKRSGRPTAISTSSQAAVQIPEGTKASYTLSDLSKELKLPRGVIRKAVEKLGLKQTNLRSRGFTSTLNQYRFSYEEYLIIVNNLKKGKG